MRFHVVCLATAALAALPAASRPQQGEDEAGVQEAIRFERAKQAAADRQARIEARRGGESNGAERSEARASEESNGHAKRRTGRKSGEEVSRKSKATPPK